MGTNDTPYLSYLDQEIQEAEREDEPLAVGLHTAIKDLLLSSTGSAAASTARRVDTIYSETFLSHVPLARITDDRGMAGFLNALWEIVFEVSKYLPYTDLKQDTLVQFIIELRKLPTRSVKIWNEECVVYTKEPIFFSVMNDHWNRNYVRDEGQESFREESEKWVNFSAFIARCTGSRLDTEYPDVAKHASLDIPRGLEQNRKPGLHRDSDFKVAAQYVLHAHSVLYEYWIEKATDGSKGKKWALEQWPVWVKRFDELAVEYNELGNTALASMAKEAREKLSLYRV